MNEYFTPSVPKEVIQPLFGDDIVTNPLLQDSDSLISVVVSRFGRQCNTTIGAGALDTAGYRSRTRQGTNHRHIFKTVILETCMTKFGH